MQLLEYPLGELLKKDARAPFLEVFDLIGFRGKSRTL